MKTLFISLLICLPITGISQYDIEKAAKDSSKRKSSNLYELKQNVYVGSALSLSFGRNTYLYAAPQMGYDLHKTFSVGIQGSYMYYRVLLFTGGIYAVNAYSGGIYAKYKPIDNISFETSLNLYNTDQIDPFITGKRINTQSWLGGISYNRPFGGKGYGFFSIYYNFIRDLNTPEPLFFRNLDNTFYLHYKYGVVFYPFS